MAPKAAGTNAATSSVNLSQRDQELLAMIWQCIETEPKIDNAKFMKLAGFTNPGSASNAWRNLRTKLGLTSPASKAEGAKGNNNKRKPAAADGSSPTKKARGTKGKASVAETVAGAAAATTGTAMDDEDVVKAEEDVIKAEEESDEEAY